MAGAGEPPAAAGEPAGEPAAVVPAVPSTDYTLDAAELAPKFDELATGFEQQQTKLVTAQIEQQVREERKSYIELLRQPARALIGRKVPSLTGNGDDTLRDAADARDWQEAVAQALNLEVESKVSARQEELSNVYSTVHASIDLFRNNADLVPGTKQFDKDLAEAFVTSAKDYEIRSGGKLIGYSIPVQPIINALRSQIVARRSAAAAPTAAQPAATAQQQRAAEQPRTETGQWSPQAGIRSSAGQSGGGDDTAAGVLEAFLRNNGVR